MVQQPLPHLGQLFLAHLAVCHYHRCIRQKLLDGRSAPVDGIHPIVQVEHLPATAQLLADGLHQNSPVVLHHIGLHRLTVLRRLLDGGHIPYARHRHV